MVLAGDVPCVSPCVFAKVALTTAPRESEEVVESDSTPGSDSWVCVFTFVPLYISTTVARSHSSGDLAVYGEIRINGVAEINELMGGARPQKQNKA